MNRMDPEADRDDRIRGHYTEMWGPIAQELTLGAGPEHELPPRFRVLLFAPSKSRTLWTYATSSMSIPEEPRGLKLHMFTHERDDSIVELLTATAHFQRTGSTLDQGHTVNFGRPWRSGSKADHGLLSLPFLDGPFLEWLPILNRRIRFLWLIPLTGDEVQFKKSFGLEALERLLERSGADLMDPNRTSVVPKGA